MAGVLNLLMLQPFSIVPHVVGAPNLKITFVAEW